MTFFFNKKSLLPLLLITLFIVSCSKDDDDDDKDEDDQITLNNAVNDFVWGSMNSWYFWQESVTNLADTKDDNQEDYYAYLNSFSSPEALFNSFIFSQDDFSYFIDDYEEFLDARQGTSESFGFRPQLVLLDDDESIIMYIQYVADNSPADLAGFKRGDIVNAINGTVMTVDNYSSVFDGFYQTTAEFSFTESDGVTFKESKSITQTIIDENPVHFTKIFEDIGGKKVGYLVYNGFVYTYDDELNQAFGEFKNAGIDELILDFRSNGGGSVSTSAHLASMIYNGADENTDFAKLTYNNKHPEENISYTFENELTAYDSEGNDLGTQEINRLSGINKIYVLTSSGTASASEMIINGLRPFIDVIVVGDTTTGKDEGSSTLFDSPEKDFRPDFFSEINPDHKIALQPILFKVYNTLGQADYSDGFVPDIPLLEYQFWNNILPFGDENEVLLKGALDDIRGFAARAPFEKVSNAKKIEKKFYMDKFEKEMYIDNRFLE